MLIDLAEAELTGISIIASSIHLILPDHLERERRNGGARKSAFETT